MRAPREERLRQLARQFSPEVAKYLRRRAYPLNDADVEDLVEEVLEIAWRRLDDVPLGAELPWMIGVARNVLSNARRKDSRRRRQLSQIRPHGLASSAEENVVAIEQLLAAVASLSASDQEVLFLHYWEGFNTDAIATVLKISKGASTTRLSRASTRLQEAFEENSAASELEPLERTREE